MTRFLAAALALSVAGCVGRVDTIAKQVNAAAEQGTAATIARSAERHDIELNALAALYCDGVFEGAVYRRYGGLGSAFRNEREQVCMQERAKGYE